VDGEAEVVEFGPPAAPGRWPSWLPVAVALVAGLAAGFLIGRGQQSTGAATPPPSASSAPAPVVVNPVQATGRTCAITLAGPSGHPDLELGAEISNRSTKPLILWTPGVDLPLGGLPIARPPTLNACGELPGITDTVLPGGGSTWISVRVHVPKGYCPAAEPVLFVANFRMGGRDDEFKVGGFNDLGQVPYPGCP
jgi:hypothetical protein